MFHKLNRKFTLLALISVTVVFVVFGISIFFCYRTILKDDYDTKTTYYFNNQVSSIESSLWMSEFYMDTFFKRTQLSTDSIPQPYALQSEMKRIQGFYSDIAYTFLVISNESDVSSFSPYGDDKLIDSLLLQYPQLFAQPSETIRWYYLKGEDVTTDMLLCMKTLPNNEDFLYTFGISLYVDSLLPITHTQAMNDLFFKKNFSLSIVPDKDAQLYLYSSKASTSSDFENGNDYLSQALGNRPLTLCMQVSNTSINQMLSLFLVGVLILCSFLFLSAFVILKVFLKKLNAALTQLHNQFASFLSTFEH